MNATKTRTGYALVIDGIELAAATIVKNRNGERYNILRDGEYIGNIFCRRNGASWWSQKPGERTPSLPGSFEDAVRKLMA